MIRGRSKAEAERAGASVATRPPFPQVRGADQFLLRLARISNPEQFQIGLAEEEPTACSALAGMHVRLAFLEPKRGQPLCGGRIDASADEEVIALQRHHTSWDAAVLRTWRIQTL